MFQTPAYQKVIKTAKPLLILVLAAFIIFKLFYSYHINTLFQKYELQQQTGSVWFLITAIILMLLNWGLESVKWKMLLQKFEPVSLRTSVKAVLSGVTLSIITPNQIGDFVGRVIHLEVLNKIKGSLVTVIGHTAQVIVTLAFGTFSFVYFSNRITGIGQWIPIGFVIIPILILAFLNLEYLYRILKKWNWMVKFEDYVNVFGAYSRPELSKVLGLSFLRYLVFLFQYYLLLQFFQVEISFWPAIACIIGTFCVQSIVPSFLLIEIGLRGVSALYFFSIFSNNQEGILLSAYSLWIINMLIPALFGMYFIYKVRS